MSFFYEAFNRLCEVKRIKCDFLENVTLGWNFSEKLWENLNNKQTKIIGKTTFIYIKTEKNETMFISYKPQINVLNLDCEIVKTKK